MATYLGKSCSFGLLCVPFVNCSPLMYLFLSLLVSRAVLGYDCVSVVSDHGLSLYFRFSITD